MPKDLHFVRHLLPDSVFQLSLHAETVFANEREAEDKAWAVLGLSRCCLGAILGPRADRYRFDVGFVFGKLLEATCFA